MSTVLGTDLCPACGNARGDHVCDKCGCCGFCHDAMRSRTGIAVTIGDMLDDYDTRPPTHAANAETCAGFEWEAVLSRMTCRSVPVMRNIVIDVDHKYGVLKRDGSVGLDNGCCCQYDDGCCAFVPLEFASTPIPLREVEGRIDTIPEIDVVRRLSGLGFRPNGTCGLHVHVGRDLVTPLSAWKACRVVGVGSELHRLVFGRNLNRFAGAIQNDDRMSIAQGRRDHIKYLAIRRTRRTVELRRWSATPPSWASLDDATWVACALQGTVALWRWARDVAGMRSVFRDFVLWAARRGRDYGFCIFSRHAAGALREARKMR